MGLGVVGGVSRTAVADLCVLVDIHVAAVDVDSQAACLILEDFYRSRGVGATVVRADDAVASAAEESGGEEAGKKGSAPPATAAVGASQPASSRPVSYRVRPTLTLSRRDRWFVGL